MLTDTVIRNTKPSEKTRRLYDEGRLYLEVSPAGGKLWHLKYRFGSKEKLLALGKYPEVSLKEPHERRNEALANGVDPGAVRKAQKQARHDRDVNSSETIAREWFAQWKTTKAESHSSKIIARLENDVFPWLGAKPIDSITAPDVLAVLRRIENRGVRETVQRSQGKYLPSHALRHRYGAAGGQ